MKPRIDQALAGMHHGDAITHDALAMRAALRRAGYRSDIVCNPEHLQAELRSEADDFRRHQPGERDVVIYHCSTATPLTDWYLELNCRRLIRYHNITPPEHYRSIDECQALQLAEGRLTLPRLAEVTEHALCVSAFNAADLRRHGFARTSVLPILMDTSAWEGPPDAASLDRLRADPRPKILFVGRVVPNKCQHELIRVHAVHRRVSGHGALLDIVGSLDSSPQYSHMVRSMADHLDLGDSVRFSGHVTHAELLAHYHAADLFLCLSEHEGFCVPLLEAMHHSIPVIAHAAGAVPETLGDAGFLLRCKHLPAIAELVDLVLTDEHLRRALIKRQLERLAQFDPRAVGKRFLALIGTLVG